MPTDPSDSKQNGTVKNRTIHYSLGQTGSPTVFTELSDGTPRGDDSATGDDSKNDWFSKVAIPKSGEPDVRRVGSVTEMSETSDQFSEQSLPRTPRSPMLGQMGRKMMNSFAVRRQRSLLQKHRRHDTEGTIGTGITIPIDFLIPKGAPERTLSESLLDAMSSVPRLLPRGAENYRIKIMGDLAGKYARDIFHTLAAASWTSLLTVMIILYLGGFLLFALIYWLGHDGLGRIIPQHRADLFATPEELTEAREVLLSYEECIYFSVQVFHAIGFGIAEPTDHFVNWVTVFHVIYAYIFNAVTIGIIFARFSSGRLRAATILFSDYACVTPGDATHPPSFCVRVMNLRDEQLLSISFGMIMIQDKSSIGSSYKITPLKVQEPKFPLLALPWTIKHTIDKNSPLFKQHVSDLSAFSTEIIVYLEGVDETTGNLVQAKRSYTANEILYESQFDGAVAVDKDGNHVVSLHKFNSYNPPLNGAEMTNMGSDGNESLEA